MNGRQEYMDSLQYLIDLTRNYTEGDLEKRNDYAKKNIMTVVKTR